MQFDDDYWNPCQPLAASREKQIFAPFNIDLDQRYSTFNVFQFIIDRADTDFLVAILRNMPFADIEIF